MIVLLLLLLLLLFATKLVDPRAVVAAAEKADFPV